MVNNKNVSTKKTFPFPLLCILCISIGLLVGIVYERMHAEQEVMKLAMQDQKTVKQETNTVSQTDADIFKKTSAILAPKQGEVLCLGQKYTIKWRVPADDVEGITLKIALPENEDTIHTIGSFPGTYNSDQPGNGSFTWVVGYNTDNVYLTPGPAYHIFLQGDYKGWGLLSADSPLFTIDNCSQNH